MITLKEFFDRARDGKLTGIRCEKCGELTIPPREFCSVCGQQSWGELTLSGLGTIASYTVIHVAPARHTGDVPYAVAVVRLKEGVALLGRVVDLPLHKLAVGLPVKFRPLSKDGQTVLGFAGV